MASKSQSYQSKTGFSSGAFGSRSKKDRRGPGKIFLDGVDLGIGGTIFLLPLVMGGRLAAGQLLLVGLACWTAVSWSLYQYCQPRSSWRWSGAELLFLAGGALAVFQFVPLSAELIETISPKTFEVLPLWSSEGGSGFSGLGEWSYLSLTPVETKSGLANLCAYALLFLVTVQRIRRVEDVQRLLKWIAISTAGMAFFGLVQLLASNGKYFWVYEHPFADTFGVVKGSFTNRNHFAHYLALGVGPLIWWLLKALNKNHEEGSSVRSSFGSGGLSPHQLILGIGCLSLAVVVLSVLLSQSRGGALTVFLASLVCLGLLSRTSLINAKFVLGLGVVGLLIGGGLMIYGDQLIQARLDTLISGDVEELERSSGRKDIWKAVMAGIQDYPLVGTGLGSHREIYPIYMNEVHDKEFTHAENGYLQVALEAGGIGLFLVLAGIGLCFFWCLKAGFSGHSDSLAACSAAVVASITASVFHSLFDFVWYVPGCLAVVIVLAACGCRLGQISRETRGEESLCLNVPRFAWMGALGVLAVLGVWMVGTKTGPLAAESHWHRYLKLALAENDPSEDESLTPQQREEMGLENLRQKMSALTKAVRANPQSGRIQLRTAMGYLTLFHVLQKRGANPMSLAQIRDAAIASQFESKEALHEWLERALGENSKYLSAALKHTHRALRLCPLQGHGYLYLSELSFLGNVDSESRQKALLDQALVVRPYDAQILFAAGRFAWFEGDIEQAVTYWKGTFHRSKTYQKRLINLLSQHVGAEFFLQNFDPDWESLGRLRTRYRELNRSQDYKAILQKYAQASLERARQLEGFRSVNALVRTHSLYSELGQTQQAVECLEHALEMDPNSFNARFALGKWYFDREDYDRAAEYLVWCSRRKPDHQALKKMVNIATKESFRDHSSERTAEGRSGEFSPKRF